MCATRSDGRRVAAATQDTLAIRRNGRGSIDARRRSPGGWPVAIALLLAACSGRRHDEHAAEDPTPPPKAAAVVLAPAPAMTVGTFPCSDCHEAGLPWNNDRRALQTAHTEIALVHGGERMWCWDCHDGAARDKLRTAGGVLIDIADAQELCGQCHSPQYRDWKSGVHGKRTGNFLAPGETTQMRCAACHPAHAPKPKPRQPKPGPVPPRKQS